MRPASVCDFCDEFSGGVQNAFSLRYGDDISDRSLLATSGFRVIPSLGQIVEGYLLIVPVMHYRAFAEMTPNLFVELGTICDRVRAALTNTYGPCLLFEHGAWSEVAGGCGIYHAHLHAVPFTYEDQRPLLVKLLNGFPHRRLEILEDIRTAATPYIPYLYYEDPLGERYLFHTRSLPSQYMRQLLASAIGKAEWDWRKCGKEQALLSALSCLSAHFQPKTDEKTCR